MLVTNDNLWDQDVAEGLCLVDVWADWCGPCHDMGDLLDAVEPDYPDVRFIKAKIDDNMSHAYKLGVDALPALMFFIDGRLMDVMEGAVAYGRLVKAVEHWRGIHEKIDLGKPIRV